MRYQSRNNRTAHPLSPVKPPPKIANAPFMHYPTARHVLRGLDEVAKCVEMVPAIPEAHRQPAIRRNDRPWALQCHWLRLPFLPRRLEEDPKAFDTKDQLSRYS
jgi:hypothetical protein